MKRNIMFYPAVFSIEDVGFSVVIPDIEGCFSEGNTLNEACLYTKDAIGLCLEDSVEFPVPSNPSDIKLEKGQFIVMLEFDMNEYKKRNSKKTIKKTLTIPAWLNAEAERKHVNFSGVLSSALRKHLDL